MTHLIARVAWGQSRKALALALAVGLLAAACGSQSPTGSPTAGGSTNASASSSGGSGTDVATVNWATSYPITSLDPGLVYDSGGNNNVTFTECDSLLQFGPDLSLQPMLATSWKQTDPTTYVYELRDDVTFWDGTKLTAADAAYSINRILDPKFASPLAGLTSTVDKAVATGPLEMTLKLKQVDPRAVWLAATPVGQVVEEAFATKLGADFGTAPDKVMCTGPYRPVEWDKGSKTVLDAVSTYWDKANQPKIKQVTFTEITDSATIVAGLRSGQIDGTFTLDARNAQLLEGDPDLNVVVGEGTQINYLAPNFLKGPFQDQRVREAYSLAIDRTGIASAVSGTKYAQPLKGPWTPDISAWSNTEFMSAYTALPVALSPDLQKAKQLIIDAGATGANVTILVLESPTADVVAPAIQQAGTSIGLNVTIKKLDPADFSTEEFSGKLPRTYDAMLNYWAPDFPDLSGIIVNQFASSFNNVFGYEDPAFRALEAQWSQAPNQSETQAAALIAMTQMLINKSVEIPLYVDPLVTVTSKKISGYTTTKLYYYQDYILHFSGH